MMVIKPFIEPFWKDIRALLMAGKKDGVFQFDSLDVALNYVQASMSYPYHLNILETNKNTVELDSEFIDALVQLIMKGVC